MDQIKEHIFTIEEFHEEKVKEKGSVFIAQAFPVKTEAEFLIILEKIRKNFYDASHHCWAFKLNDESFKYSDDGEPNGTAGIRILNALDHFNLVDAALIVIRYFGGTKLGVGPLGRAYYNSAVDALQKSTRIKCCGYYRIIFEIRFDEINHAHRIAGNYNLIINEINYSENVRFDCFIKFRGLDSFSAKLIEAIKRKIDINKEKNIFYLRC